MNKLEQELVDAAKLPNNSAVKYSKKNEQQLCQNHHISRQSLRQMAMTLDKMVRMGHKFVAEVAKVAVPEKKIKLAKAKVPKDVPKADAKPPKPKAKAKAKPKAKVKPKKKSKPKT